MLPTASAGSWDSSFARGSPYEFIMPSVTGQAGGMRWEPKTSHLLTSMKHLFKLRNAEILDAFPNVTHGAKENRAPKQL